MYDIGNFLRYKIFQNGRFILQIILEYSYLITSNKGYSASGPLLIQTLGVSRLNEKFEADTVNNKSLVSSPILPHLVHPKPRKFNLETFLIYELLN